MGTSNIYGAIPAPFKGTSTSNVVIGDNLHVGDNAIICCNNSTTSFHTSTVIGGKSNNNNNSVSVGENGGAGGKGVGSPVGSTNHETGCNISRLDTGGRAESVSGKGGSLGEIRDGRDMVGGNGGKQELDVCPKPVEHNKIDDIKIMILKR